MIGEVTQEKAVAFLAALFEERDSIRSDLNLANYTIERKDVAIVGLEAELDGQKEEWKRLRKTLSQVLKERDELRSDSQTLSEKVARLVQDKSWAFIQSEKKLLDKEIERSECEKSLLSCREVLKAERTVSRRKADVKRVGELQNLNSELQKERDRLIREFHQAKSAMRASITELKDGLT